MLTIEQIYGYFDKSIVNNNPKSILVEYLQFELLDSLFKFKESRQIVFIGGTSIRIVHNSNRFSEDLDFDNFGLTYDEFELLLNRVIKDMELKGFIINFKYVEKDAWHCYIRFPELLYKFGLSPNDKEKILIRIDMQKKEKTYKPFIAVLNKFGIFRKIQSAPKEILLSQKLITIIQRKREKGRDIYDTCFLYGLTTPDYFYINKNLNLEIKEFNDVFYQRLIELDFNDLAKDVEPFLINPDEIARILYFREFIDSLKLEKRNS
jgi:predicted nucleotidyltransferase component of viral defense system